MSVNLPLDDIIAQNKKSKGGRQIGGFRSANRDRDRDDAPKPRGGRGKAGGFRSTNVPDGRWKHDMFGRPDAVGGGGRKEVATKIGGGGGNPRVRVLLSNLAATVNTADLEELFDPYNLESVNVHFNERGEPVGTGDLSLRKKDAIQMLQDLKGLAIDEQVVKMALVDETSTVTTGTIRDRIKLGRGAGNGGDLRRTIRGGVQKRQGGQTRSAEGRPAYDMHDDRVERKRDGPRTGGGGGRRGGGGRGGGRGGGGKKALTEEELNSQLDAYMSKGKDDDMD